MTIEKSIVLKVGLVAVGGVAVLGFLIAESAPGTPLHTFETELLEPSESTLAIGDRKEAQFWAETFTERLSELSALYEENELEPDAVAVIREDVRTAFLNAFEAIEQSEKGGQLEETAVARATMQTAIEYHLTMSKAVDAEIYEDLQEYSKQLTESLIQVALIQ